MAFADHLRIGRLDEKPWRADAVVRLAVSVVMCCLIGAVVSEMFRYFAVPGGKSPALFLACSIAAIVCLLVALLILMRPWQFEDYVLKLLLVFICINTFLLLTWLAGRLIPEKQEFNNSTITMLIAVLSFQGAAIVLVHFFLREYHMSWSDGFGFDRGLAHTLLLGVCAGIFILRITQMLLNVSDNILELFRLHPHEQELVQTLQTTEGWQNRVVLGIATILIAPPAEEILFRGILYPSIKRAAHQQIALWSTALIFAAIHANLAAFVPLVFLAVVLVYLYEYTGNLLACIVAHSLFNAANFVALYWIQK